MSFEHNPADEIQRDYEDGLLVDEIRRLQAENAALRQQLAEARAEVETANKIAEGESEQSIGYYEESISLKDKLAARAAELERLRATIERNESRYAGIDMVYEECESLRKKLAQSTNYITDDCEYPHHIWFANGRHVELVYPQGRSILNVDMQLHEAFSNKDDEA